MRRIFDALTPYLAALAATVAIAAFPRITGLNTQGLLVIVPVIIAAWLGGLWPGAFATALVFGGAAFVTISRNISVTRVLPIALIGLVISLLFELLHRSRRHLVERQRQLEAEIEQRERAEWALQEADRRKDEFLATLAHELRNPLAPISN